MIAIPPLPTWPVGFLKFVPLGMRDQLKFFNEIVIPGGSRWFRYDPGMRWAIGGDAILRFISEEDLILFKLRFG